MTVAILLTPLEMVLKEALKMEAMKRPATPGNRPIVSMINKGYNYRKKIDNQTSTVLPSYYLI